VEIGKGKKKEKIKLIIWDMAGQDVFKELRKSFYDGATGLVLMFDITRKRTFNQLPKWYREASEIIGEQVPVVVVANKSDKKPYRVNENGVTKYAKSIGAPCIITSALTGSNVTDLFELLGKTVHAEIQDLRKKKQPGSKKSKSKRMGSKKTK
jgi:small GTP-binding protein